MFLSIIIPTLNEADNLSKLLPYLGQHLPAGRGELIVVDAGSEDDTLATAQAHGADHALLSPTPGRAPQMNHAAQLARGDVFYFVHADTLPPQSFYADIERCVQLGHQAGSYRTCFDRNHFWLKLNAYMTRFDRLFCRGGDQSIFSTRDLFESVGGYRDDYRIMEDYDFIQKARSRGVFHVMQKDILISTRKYEGNSYLRVNLANLVIVLMYLAGASQRSMVNMYKRLLNCR